MYNNYVDQLHQAAANGDVEAVLEALRAVPDVNATNNRGWTALMFAARNGHKEAVTVLLDKGADISMRNSVGQNAVDIAEFWQSKETASVLSKATETQEHLAAGLPVAAKKSNFFCDSPLDRTSQRRNDKEWLESLTTKNETIYVLFTRLQPLARSNPVPPKYSLVRFSFAKAKTFLSSDATVVFLGVEHASSDAGDKSSDVRKAVGWFAVDCGDLTPENIGSLEDGAVLLSNPLDLFQLSRSEAAIVAQARSLMAWHERYKFCSTCGSATIVEDAGYKRVCVSEGCASRKGIHNTSYPRTDPTVIMAVMSPDRSQILLGKGKRHRLNMWTCLAGFMEPGEGIEEAVRREVHEESGIRVGQVDYHSSQPWPMPSSLMIGCIAHAQSTTIEVDKDELEDAKWFDALEVQQMLSRRHPQGFFCPPEQAVAHQLIRYWVSNVHKL